MKINRVGDIEKLGYQKERKIYPLHREIERQKEKKKERGEKSN